MQGYDIIIKDTHILDETFSVQKSKDIYISGNQIVAIKDSGNEEVEACQVINGKNKLFMPGLVDSHMHTNQQLLRGRILDELPMIWTRIMLPYEDKLTDKIVEIGAKLACLEMIRSGTTAFVEAGGKYMKTVADVTEASGLRALLTCSTMDGGDPHIGESVLVDNKELYTYCKEKKSDRIQVGFSLRALQVCSPKLIEDVVDLAQVYKAPIHAHMNEYPNEVMGCLEKYGMRPIEYLHEMGAINNRFISAHTLFTSQEELDILQDQQAKVVHCPFSNCGKGTPSVVQMLNRRITTALGTDGAAHGGLSLWNEMKILRSVINVTTGVQTANPVILPAKTILQMATRGGAEILQQKGQLGVLKEGAKADLIGVNICSPHMYPTSNLINTLVEQTTHGDIEDMIVDGQVLMLGRQLTMLDEEKILYEAQQIHNELFG